MYTHIYIYEYMCIQIYKDICICVYLFIQYTHLCVRAFLHALEVHRQARQLHEVDARLLGSGLGVHASVSKGGFGTSGSPCFKRTCRYVILHICVYMYICRDVDLEYRYVELQVEMWVCVCIYMYIYISPDVNTNDIEINVYPLSGLEVWAVTFLERDVPQN